MHSRDLALDFAKGALVVFMVIYHAMSILSTAGPEDFQHIRFVSGSFIFLSGYVVARFHFDRFLADRRGTTSWLLQRGCKLVLLFTALNLLIPLTGIGNPGKSQPGILQYAGNFAGIYVLGDSRYASFQILLPIAYLLMLSPVFLRLVGRSKAGGLTALATTFACTLVPIESPHWELTVLGAIGLSAGMLESISHQPFPTASGRLASVALVVCIGLMGALSRYPASYAIGVAAVTKLLYDLGKIAHLPRHLVLALVVLGRYSLPGYLAQIAILRILFIALTKERLALGLELATLIAATSALLFGMCVLLDLLRDRYRLVHKSYKLFFS